MDTVVISSVGWGVLLVLAVPFAIIVLNEMLERWGKQRGDAASVLRMARDLVLPAAVLAIVLRIVFNISTENALANLASTVFWLFLIVLIYRLSVLVIGDGEYEPGDWRARSPQLFLRLVPYSLMGLVVYHVSQNLWALPVREMATTLGIGSVVIAFALQATLSNLVSGLLMIANSPFKTGDWVQVGDFEGQIIGVNWRYTEILDWKGNLVVFPNGSIADGSIYNFSRPTIETLIPHDLQFSLSTPPNEVKRLLLETMAKTPHILADPAPAVFLSGIENPIMTYTVEYWIDDFGGKDGIKSDFLTRVWYGAHRENIPIPLPKQEFLARKDQIEAKSREEVVSNCRAALEALPSFANVSSAGMDELVSEATILRFAETERILDAGDTEAGLYVLLTGKVQLEAVDPAGLRLGPLEIVRAGGIFGENGLFGRAISPLNVKAQTDCTVILLPHRRFIEVLKREHDLNDNVNAVINQRNRAARKLASTHANGNVRQSKNTQFEDETDAV